MPRYFMRDTPLRAMERLMMSQPGHKPRGGGMYRSQFCYTPKAVECEYCQSYDRKNPCLLCACTWLEERIEADGKLNFYIQADFDVDSAFGTFVYTDQNDDWLNIYANYDVE